MYIKLQVITATTTSHWNLHLHNKQQSRKLEDTIKRRTDNVLCTTISWNLNISTTSWWSRDVCVYPSPSECTMDLDSRLHCLFNTTYTGVNWLYDQIQNKRLLMSLFLSDIVREKKLFLSFLSITRMNNERRGMRVSWLCWECRKTICCSNSHFFVCYFIHHENL
jgi:hypothetical protein